MSERPDGGDYWQAVRRALGGECVAYTPEELAAFAEGRMRKAEARLVQAHLDLCVSCRELVDALRAEAQRYEPAKTVRVRPTPVGGWGPSWVFAPVAVAAMAVIVVVALHTRQAPAPAGDSKPQPMIADRTGAQGPAGGAADDVPPPTRGESRVGVPTPPKAGPVPGSGRPAASRRSRRQGGTGRGPVRPETPGPDALEDVPFDQAIAQAPRLLNEFTVVLAFSPEETEDLFSDLPPVDPDEHPEMVNALAGGVPAALDSPESAHELLSSPVNGPVSVPSSQQLWTEAQVP